MENAYRELIDYVINKHHRYLNEELPQLSPYVTKSITRPRSKSAHLAQIHKLFHELKMELEQHLIKEETEDFPLILEFEQNPIDENYVKLRKIVDELKMNITTQATLLKNFVKLQMTLLLQKELAVLIDLFTNVLKR